MIEVYVNGRFSLQRLTGVQRHAREVSARLGERVRMVRPTRVRGQAPDHLWEQFFLPRVVRDNVLWSPCGTGPLGIRRQVITVHDTGFVDTPQYYARRFAAWYRWLIPRLIRRVAHVITVSEFTRGQLVQHYQADPDKISVAPNGVEGFAPAAPEAVAAARARQELPGPYLLYVGSLKPNKNLDRVLAAWERAGLAARGYELAVVGAAGTVFGDHRLARLPRGVRLLGYVDDADLPALYTGALAFVFPSLYEGFGMPAAEAMACGTPVLASSTTSLPEVCGEAAVLVDPTSVEKIAEGLLALVDSESFREDLRERGLKQVRQFTWRRAADTTWQVLERVQAESV